MRQDVQNERNNYSRKKTGSYAQKPLTMHYTL